MEFTRPPTVATERAIRASYDAIFRRAPLRDSDAHYAWVARVLGPEKGLTLLDIACGGGCFLREALARGTLAVGVDLSTEALKLARENAPAPPSSVRTESPCLLRERPSITPSTWAAWNTFSTPTWASGKWPAFSGRAAGPCFSSPTAFS
jgi:SAM-dependent methyltransferase